MKKLYSLFVAVLVCAVNFAAFADSFTFKVNMPDKVTVRVNGDNVELTGESTVITCDQYAGVNVELADGYLIKSFVNQAGTPQNNYGNYTYFSPENGDTYIMEIYNADDARTGSCVVKVDDASKVRVMRSGTYSNVTLSDGVNTVRFNPETETQLLISPSGSDPIYKVLLAGTSVAGSGSSFAVDMTQDCEIEIITEFPDVPCTITFTYGDKAEGFFTGATVNYETYPDFDGKSMTVKAGATVGITGNTSAYNFESMTVNGNPVQYFYGSYSFTVLEDTEIHVEAHPWGQVSFTLNIDDPANVSVYRGYSYNNDKITNIVAGPNTLSLPENNAMLDIQANAGCFITSITDAQGNTLSSPVTVTEGMVINVVSGAIVKDQTAIVWIDDKAAAVNYFGCAIGMGSQREQPELVTGYNIVPFSQQYNSMNISWYGAPNNELYLNGEKQNGYYDQDNNYYLTLTDGDVIKVFLAAAPADVTVKFQADGDVEAAVKRDIVTDVAAWDGLTETVFKGTQYNVSGSDIKVEVNSVALTANAEGDFVFTADGDCDAKISAAAGIAGIEADSAAAAAKVYNLQGVCVGTRAQMTTLPAGLYIVDGRKQVVK